MTTRNLNEWKGLLFALVAVIVAGAAVQGFAVWLHLQNPPDKVAEKPASPPPLEFKTSPELIDNGQKLFLHSCARCHGDDAHGGEGAPALVDLQRSDERIAFVILHGVRNKMPAFEKKLQGEDVVAIVAFLRSLK